jgi:nucleoside-diphosphate-sugar epimerase
MTGATGFLGSHLLRALLKRGNRVYCLKRGSSRLDRVSDIASKAIWVDVEKINFDDFFAHQHIECVLHCATDYGRKKVDPVRTIEANLILPLKLLHAAASHGVAAFINTDTVLDKRINNYSLSKKQFMDWLESYSNQIIGVNVALEHFFGPGDDPSKFVTSIIHSLLSGVESIKLTPGYQRRDFIYIDDVIDAFLKLLDAANSLDRKFHRFEVGTGRTIEIRTFVQLIKQLSGNQRTRLDFGALPFRENEYMDCNVDTAGLRELGWQAVIPLEEGLTRTILAEKAGALRNAGTTQSGYK